MLKIGKIPYTNLFPIYYYLSRINTREYEFIEGSPSEVNKFLRNKIIDVSPSSSIEYLRRPDRYILISGHSLSSEGHVGSILLFSKRPIKALDGLPVLYSYQSETSVALLKIIFSLFYGLDCKLKLSKLSLNEGLKDHNAYLLIGDDALQEALRWPDLFKYDLGDIWYKETGLPFVFALWIANKEAEEISMFKSDLNIAKEKAKKNMLMIAKECPSNKWLPEEKLIAYWKRLSYDMEDKHSEGLELFRKYLLRLRIL